MSDYVVDTNVWVMVDKTIADVTTLEELACIENCVEWLREFANSAHRLVIDNQYLILREYRGQIRKGGLAQQLLNRLETLPRERLVEVQIELDEDGYAKVPPLLIALDPSDRKFVAVALAHNPTPTIIDATESDWAKVERELSELGLTVDELCADYLARKLERDMKKGE